MDVKKIKYNYELLKHRARIENELIMVEEELKESKKNCYHVAAVVGENGGFTYRQCLLCGTKITSNINRNYNISALGYKDNLYNKGSESIEREKRYKDLQALTIKVLEENEIKDEYDLYLKIQEEIEKEREERKQLKKIKE